MELPATLGLHYLLRRHAFDWLTVIVLAILLAIIEATVKPFHRVALPVVLEELKYPVKTNTVPSAAVPVIAFAPAAVFVVYFIWRREKSDLHQSLLGLCSTIVVTGLITEYVKDMAGRLRPDFYYRCFPDGKEVFGPTGDVACTGVASVVLEGRKSFPSGHSSWTFAGMVYLSLWTAGKLELFNRKGHVYNFVLVALPLAAAVAVALSRLQDYWHHWQDVTVGGLLGALMAILFYRQFYPSLADPSCGQPHIALSSVQDAEACAPLTEDIENQAAGRQL